MRLLSLALLALAASAAHVSAQEATCHSTPGYFVAVSNNQEDLGIDNLGESISIHKLATGATKACSFDSTADTVLMGNYEFEQAFGSTLILTEASAKDIIHAFDMDTGMPILTVEAYPEAFNPTELIYWEYGEDGTAENCPEYETYMGYGGMAVIARQVKYQLDIRRAIPTGQSRCDYQQ